MKHGSGNQAIAFLKDEYSEMFQSQELLTPAFIYDEGELLRALCVVRELAEGASCRILYSLKASSIHGVLEVISGEVQGFGCSSLFEAVLARELSGGHQTVHYTSPGVREAELPKLAEVCDYLTINSISQWDRFRAKVESKTSWGIRVNPKLSFISDERYDPSRKFSKLGVPTDQLLMIYNRDRNFLRGISGLHFHNNCDSSEFTELLSTVRHIDDHLAGMLSRVDWINFGGGYLFDRANNLDAFYESVELIRSKYKLEVFIEPGAAIVRKAAYLISTVLDLFIIDGKEIAVLDTTVNHMPEVFEYQFQPTILGHNEGGRHSYILVGCTCLSGDQFGEYAFDEPLEIGSRVVFLDVGAYTFVKAHMFNGVNLPTIYAYTQDQEFVLKKEFDYNHFKSRCGVAENDSI